MKRNTERRPMFVLRLNGPKLDKTQNVLALKYGINYVTIKSSEIAFFYTDRVYCLMVYIHAYLDSIKLTCMCWTNFTIELFCFRVLINPYPDVILVQRRGGRVVVPPGCWSEAAPSDEKLKKYRYCKHYDIKVLHNLHHNLNQPLKSTDDKI